MAKSLGLHATVIVAVTHYVFLFKRLPDLHFDDLDRHFACASDAMPCPTFDEHMVAIGELQDALIKRDLRDSAYDHPMFVAVFMALQAKALPRIDNQPFYLGVRPIFEHEEGAPRSFGSVVRCGHQQESLGLSSHTSYHHPRRCSLEQIVSLVFKLALYPVVCIGAGLSLGALYSWLRHCPYPEVAVKVRAQLLTGLVALIALCIMAPGAPVTLASFGDWLALVLYSATAYAGGCWVWRKRNQLMAWFATTFEVN